MNIVYLKLKCQILRKKNKLKFLKNYKNSISNLKLNIIVKFSKNIPESFFWHSINDNRRFIPNFTKKIFKQVSVLF